MYSDNIDFYKEIIRDFVSSGDIEGFSDKLCKKWREDRDEEFEYVKGFLEPEIIAANPGISFVEMKRKVCDVLYDGCHEETHAISDIFVLMDYYYPEAEPIRVEILSKYTVMLD